VAGEVLQEGAAHPGRLAPCYLLDRWTRIFELENMRLKEYEGNYTQYRAGEASQLVTSRRTTWPTKKRLRN